MTSTPDDSSTPTGLPPVSVDSFAGPVFQDGWGETGPEEAQERRHRGSRGTSEGGPYGPCPRESYHTPEVPTSLVSRSTSTLSETPVGGERSEGCGGRRLLWEPRPPPRRPLLPAQTGEGHWVGVRRRVRRLDGGSRGLVFETSTSHRAWEDSCVGARRGVGLSGPTMCPSGRLKVTITKNFTKGPWDVCHRKIRVCRRPSSLSSRTSLL